VVSYVSIEGQLVINMFLEAALLDVCSKKNVLVGDLILG
jgi:hypothetical protein